MREHTSPARLVRISHTQAHTASMCELRRGRGDVVALSPYTPVVARHVLSLEACLCLCLCLQAGGSQPPALLRSLVLAACMHGSGSVRDACLRIVKCVAIGSPLAATLRDVITAVVDVLTQADQGSYHYHDLTHTGQRRSP